MSEKFNNGESLLAKIAGQRNEQMVPDLHLGARSDLLNETAHRIWRESEKMALEKMAEEQKNKEIFLNNLRDFIKKQFQIDIDKLTSSKFSERVYVMYEDLKNQPSSDKALIDAVIKILTETLELEHDDEEDIKINFDDSYLNVFKALWGEGVPLYLSRIVYRREAIEFLELIYLWKPSIEKKIYDLQQKLKNKEIDEETFNDECRKLITEAEQEIWNEIKDTFEELCISLFEKEMSQIFKGDLETNSIYDLQTIFQKEEGVTKPSWEKKNAAYLKLTYIYALMKIFGTINFERLKKIREAFEERLKRYESDLNNVGAEVEDTRIDVKTKISVALKYLKKMLDDKSGPYPADIRDFVRLRIAVDIPEAILEDDSIEEIKEYITNVLKKIFPIFGTSYVKSRLRNSFVAGGVNPLSGERHQALQVTFLPLTDLDDEDGECPEVVPLEAQIRKKLNDGERTQDDCEYRTKKINRLRRDSGVDVTFSDYISNLADVFIKSADFGDREQKGGEPWLSEKELLAINFLKIMSTDDTETREYMKSEWQSEKEIYKRKLRLAIREISKYWSKKLELFIKNKINLIQEILEKRNTEAGSDSVDSINLTANEIIELLESSQPDFDKIESKIRDLRTQATACSREYRQGKIAHRLLKQISKMEQYFIDRKKLNISELLENAEESLIRIFD
jgi:hypothetical protein